MLRIQGFGARAASVWSSGKDRGYLILQVGSESCVVFEAIDESPGS